MIEVLLLEGRNRKKEGAAPEKKHRQIRCQNNRSKTKEGRAKGEPEPPMKLGLLPGTPADVSPYQDPY